MFNFNIFLISLSIGVLLNIIGIKIIGVLDYELLGLKKRNKSILKIYRYVIKDKILLLRFSILGIVFIFLNYIILIKIMNNFSLVSLYTYFKYYYLFLILYIFAFIDYITYYIYTILSYPLIIFSLIIFILSFFNIDNIKSNIDTLVLIGFLYLIINKFKFLGEGDFDILLIVALTLGVLPTIFIFYLSIIMSGFIGLGVIIKNSCSIKNKKLAFVPFIFLSTTIFIILTV